MSKKKKQLKLLSSFNSCFALLILKCTAVSILYRSDNTGSIVYLTNLIASYVLLYRYIEQRTAWQT